MKFNTTPLQHEDYDNILKGWWKDWGWEAPSRDFLPQDGQGGIMVWNGDTPVCAGFLYNTKSLLLKPQKIKLKKNMVNIYDYQVWQTERNTWCSCADSSYIATIEQPLRPSAKVFLYIINLFIN